MQMLQRILLIALLGISFPSLVGGQQEQSLSTQQEQSLSTQQEQSLSTQLDGIASAKSGARLRSDYVLGSDDEIVIRALDAAELSNQPMRIDDSGNIAVPMIGKLHVAGLTVRELEAEVENKLARYIVDPDVSILITAYRSQPVSILGSVRTPGTYQLEGHKTLIEVLSLAGGLSSEAGNILRVTRRAEWGKIPLPDATMDEASEYSVAEFNLRSLMDARNPQENIEIMPNDVLLVPRGKMVWVVGEVKKSGGFVLPERESISVLQAIAMAEGVSPTASTKNSRIIRPVVGSNRLEIKFNLSDIMAGKSADIPLQPEDILFIPNNFAKSTFRRTLDTAIYTLMNAAIYRGW
jgi:polysaccharide biosynthesis/export protein